MEIWQSVGWATSRSGLRRGLAVIGGIGLGMIPWLPIGVKAQSLPPVPAVPNLEGERPTQGAPSAPTAPLSPTAPAPASAPAPGSPTDQPGGLPVGADASDLGYTPGDDLRQLVTLLINESLDGGDQVTADTYNELYTRLLANSYSNPTPIQELEYQLLAQVVEQLGGPADRFLTPEAFDQLLNQPRPPIQAQAVAPRTVYLAVPELTPSTATEIRQTLYTQDYTRGVILDLRGSVGYDPQVIADVARLFLPRSISPLVITEDRFGQLTGWDSGNLPIGTGVPLTVLVDSNTRQGATLLAAELALSGEVTILGQPTQGTDRQTRFFILPSGAAVELAVGFWQTGDNRPLLDGLDPMHPVAGQDQVWLNAGISALSASPRRPQVPQRPSVFAQEGRVGRFLLGMDTRNVDTSLLGNVDLISAESGKNVFQPNSDLKIFYLEDYVLFTYRHPGVLDSFFADRIYTTDPTAMTAEGLGIGASYVDVIQVYGQPGENGYNEVMPFPEGSREAIREDRYYVNYDAQGIGFVFEVGSNRVVAIGLYKPGA